MTTDTKKITRTVTLPTTGSWPQTRHQFDEKSIWAIRAAVAARRPLLVRGEPGSGKSQLARAAAHIMRRAFIFEVIHAGSQGRDLQYYYDTVARLGEAQTLPVSGNAGMEIKKKLDPTHFITPGALWWAFNWDHAHAQFERSNQAVRRPVRPAGWQPEKGTVLLIDEIDKADADLPNGLLETLGNGAFSVPYLDMPVRIPGDSFPLVIITTNEERELPAAFIRRCLVLHLKLPQAEDALLEWLCERGRIHFEDDCSEMVRREAAIELIKDRVAAMQRGLPPPGQAEYLDILRAVKNIAGKSYQKQIQVLMSIQDFALVKSHPGKRS